MGIPHELQLIRAQRRFRQLHELHKVIWDSIPCPERKDPGVFSYSFQAYMLAKEIVHDRNKEEGWYTESDQEKWFLEDGQ